MKKILTILMMIFSISMFSQNITSDITNTTTLNGDQTLMNNNIVFGSNCGNVNGNLYLNGYSLFLKNVTVNISGQIIGTGYINNYNGCQNGSILIANGVTVSLPYGTLSNDTFEFNNSIIGLDYNIYNVNGQLIKNGIIDRNLLETLPKNEILIIKVSNFKPKKLIIK